MGTIGNNIRGPKTLQKLLKATILGCVCSTFCEGDNKCSEGGHGILKSSVRVCEDPFVASPLQRRGMKHMQGSRIALAGLAVRSQRYSLLHSSRGVRI